MLDLDSQYSETQVDPVDLAIGNQEPKEKTVEPKVKIEKRTKSFDEGFAAVIYKHPCLYDKSVSDFHRKDVKLNSWNELKQEFDFSSSK